MNILVTGGAGYIGSHTVIALQEAGHTPVVADSLSASSRLSLERAAQITGQAVPFYQADVRDRKALEEILSEHAVDCCIHLAGLKAVGESAARPLDYYDDNLIGTLVLLEALRAHGCRNFIFSSSATVCGDPAELPMTEACPKGPCSSPYSRSKSMLEQILTDVQAADPAWNIVLLRYFNPVGAHPSGLIGEDPRGIPGNLMPCITQTAAGRRPRLKIFGNDYPTPDGTCIRDYIHVMDLARGHVSALQAIARHCGLAVYNLGTGRGCSVLELLHTFERVNRLQIPYEIRPRRPGDVPVLCADPAKAAAELGWRPRYGLEAMCRDAWNWQRRNPEGYTA